MQNKQKNFKKPYIIWDYYKQLIYKMKKMKIFTANQTFLLKILCLFSHLTLTSCVQNQQNHNSMDSSNLISDSKQVAIFGGGCFWCTEAIFLQVEGVDGVIPGYCGGFTNKPTYKEICTGTTGHAEVIAISYDSSKVSFKELLVIFLNTHDPTTLNRQGNDVGTQYRSVVFPQDSIQEKNTKEYLLELEQSKFYKSKIVTTIEEKATFYPAEEYHKNYFNQNREQPYCIYVVQPKVDKFKKEFLDKKNEEIKK